MKVEDKGPAPVREAMRGLLLDAYRNPGRKACYYSANGAPTGSARLNAMLFWDWTPERSLSVPGVSTCMFPLGLGCPPIRTSEGKEWVRPCLAGPEEALAFRAPDVRSGRTGEVLGNLERVAAALGPEERVRQPDIQSPLGVAELMWGEPFYLALIEHPEAVHALLGEITGFIIRFVREAARAAGGRLNAAGFPCVWADGEGTMVADDTLSLVSPAMHAEFSVPYLNRIAAACGPLFYHTCSLRAAYFDNVGRIGPLRALNWNPGNSDDPAAILPAFSGRAVIALHLCRGMHRDNDTLKLGRRFADEFEFFAYIVERMGANTCLYWWLSDVRENGPVMDKLYDFLDERGWTPRARGLL